MDNAENLNICILSIGLKFNVSGVNEIPKSFKPLLIFQKRKDTGYFMLSQEEVIWYKAVHECHKVGGHLLTITDKETLEEISEKFREQVEDSEYKQTGNTNFWIDLSVHNLNGAASEVISLSTGMKPEFLEWCEQEESEELEENGEPQCVYVENSETPCMKLSSCQVYNEYVCEPAKSPRTLSIIAH